MFYKYPLNRYNSLTNNVYKILWKIIRRWRKKKANGIIKWNISHFIQQNTLKMVDIQILYLFYNYGINFLQ